jgi:hypothetical protein
MLRNKKSLVGFKVLTPVVVKVPVCWDITPRWLSTGDTAHRTLQKNLLAPTGIEPRLLGPPALRLVSEPIELSRFIDSARSSLEPDQDAMVAAHWPDTENFGQSNE